MPERATSARIRGCEPVAWSPECRRRTRRRRELLRAEPLPDGRWQPGIMRTSKCLRLSGLGKACGSSLMLYTLRDHNLQRSRFPTLTKRAVGHPALGQLYFGSRLLPELEKADPSPQSAKNAAWLGMTIDLSRTHTSRAPLPSASLGASRVTIPACGRQVHRIVATHSTRSARSG